MDRTANHTGSLVRAISAEAKIEAIKAEYAPYNKMVEFEQGYDYYMAGKVPAFDIMGVAGQAFDRGAEAAMRVMRVGK